MLMISIGCNVIVNSLVIDIINLLVIGYADTVSILKVTTKNIIMIYYNCNDLLYFNQWIGFHGTIYRKPPMIPIH